MRQYSKRSLSQYCGYQEMVHERQPVQIIGCSYAALVHMSMRTIDGRKCSRFAHWRYISRVDRMRPSFMSRVAVAPIALRIIRHFTSVTSSLCFASQLRGLRLEAIPAAQHHNKLSAQLRVKFSTAAQR